MKLSKEGQALIEKVEGRSTTAYKDSAGLWTIGIGHLIKPAESWMITAQLTAGQIDDLFRADVASAEQAVQRLFPTVTRQNQFDALVSFTYNLGATAVQNGTLDDLINQGASAEAISAKWMQYVYSGGRVTPGLVTRRALELALYWAHLWRSVVACLALVAAALLAAGITLSV